MKFHSYIPHLQIRSPFSHILPQWGDALTWSVASPPLAFSVYHCRVQCPLSPWTKNPLHRSFLTKYHLVQDLSKKQHAPLVPCSGTPYEVITSVILGPSASILHRGFWPWDKYHWCGHSLLHTDWHSLYHRPFLMLLRCTFWFPVGFQWGNLWE